jgi:hypothetical protein
MLEFRCPLSRYDAPISALFVFRALDGTANRGWTIKANYYGGLGAIAQDGTRVSLPLTSFTDALESSLRVPKTPLSDSGPRHERRSISTDQFHNFWTLF